MTHSGLGRIGAGVASSATSSTIIMSSTWASVVPAGKVPNELVDQSQHIEVRAGHEPEDVAPVSSSTRASDARDARRSHRSVEGDVSPHGEREREETPILYKRV